MATLQKIRNRGKLLIATVGLALFAFIAEEFVRSLSYTQREQQQRIGKIYGDKINVQDFKAEVDEFTDFMKYWRGVNNLSEDDLSMLRDQVWEMLVDDKIVQHECDKLGITVTDAEMRDIISNGRNGLLSQTFFRTQDETFDVNALQEFLRQYDEIMNNSQIHNEYKEQAQQMHNYWMFIEKNIRREKLKEKYQSLLNSLMVSNPTSAQASFNSRINESDIYMAALPYSSIKDDDVKVEDSELKEKYKELKFLPGFYADKETRDIKYIDVQVTASETDEENLQKEMEGYAQALEEGADPAKTVSDASSQIAYSGMPVSAEILPMDIIQTLDSMSVGTQAGPFVNERDNTINIVRLIGKTNLPDSVEVRQIQAPGSDMATIEQTADSIMTALAAGTSFEDLAKKYNQTAEKAWVKLSQLERDINENSRKFLNVFNTAAVGSNNKIVIDGQGVLIVQITDRHNIIPKYDVAVIKRAIDFGEETFNKAFNDFSSFLAGNTKVEDIEANAPQAGYVVQTRNNVSSNEHVLVNLQNTREALNWLFDDDTEVGDVSQLYQCGNDKKNHLLVVMYTGIHKKGDLPWDDDQVRPILTSEVMKDKKAAMLLEKMKDVKSVADVAKINGAVTDTIPQVTFAGNAFVKKLGANEPALSGSVSKAKKGDFKAGVKGKSAVYAYEVLDQRKVEAQYEQKEEEQRQQQIISRSLGYWQLELRKKADISDKRYLFF